MKNKKLWYDYIIMVRSGNAGLEFYSFTASQIKTEFHEIQLIFSKLRENLFNF